MAGPFQQFEARRYDYMHGATSPQVESLPLNVAPKLSNQSVLKPVQDQFDRKAQTSAEKPKQKNLLRRIFSLDSLFEVTKIGLTVGATILAGKRLWLAALVGGGVTAFFSAADQYWHRRKVDWGQVGIEAGIGGFLGSFPISRGIGKLFGVGLTHGRL